MFTDVSTGNKLNKITITCRNPIYFLQRFIRIFLVDLYKVNWNTNSYKVVSASNAAVIDSYCYYTTYFLRWCLITHASTSCAKMLTLLESRLKRGSAAVANSAFRFLFRDKMSRRNSLRGVVVRQNFHDDSWLKL